MKTRPSIEVVPYNPTWPIYFQTLRQTIWPRVKHVALSFEHVGSTSVPGLWAKPIIDLDIVVAETAEVFECSEVLTPLGYTHVGDRGVPGRHAFVQEHAEIRHHLYVCIDGAFALRNHICLRDHLRGHPADALRYGALKRELAQRHEDDIEAYVEGKTGFIIEILERYDYGADDLAELIEVNKKPRSE